MGGCGLDQSTSTVYCLVTLAMVQQIAKTSKLNSE